MVCRKGDQLRQHYAIRGRTGGDEILRQVGGQVRRTVGDRGLLGGEVVEEGPRRNARLNADLLDGHLVEAAFLRKAHRGVTDVGAGLATTPLAETHRIRHNPHRCTERKLCSHLGWRRHSRQGQRVAQVVTLTGEEPHRNRRFVGDLVERMERARDDLVVHGDTRLA